MMVRAGLSQMLGRAAEIEIVGAASSGEEAIYLAQKTQPNIVLMDVRMAGLGGIEATRALTKSGSVGAVIGLSTFSDAADISGMREAGAKGYVMKEALTSDILEAIRRVQAGELLFPEEICEPASTATASNTPPNLGQQQRRVLALMTKGLTNPEIAAQLSVSRPTVSYHVSAILRKLDVSNRAEAVALAIRDGLVSDADI